MQYYFDELDPTTFQRLVNSVLVHLLGTDLRVTPLRGADGGRDAETAAQNPYLNFNIDDNAAASSSIFVPPRAGRYLFQVKHHRMKDARPSDARKTVINDFEAELKKNVLNRAGLDSVNYFILVTNVPSSHEAMAKLDEKRFALLHDNKVLHADIWWQDQLVAYLDTMPTIWAAFPQLFAGNEVPMLAKVINQSKEELPRAIRLALNCQYERDSVVRFRQIDLERSLSRLFVDLDITTQHLSRSQVYEIAVSEAQRRQGLGLTTRSRKLSREVSSDYQFPEGLVSGLSLLLNETSSLLRRIVLVGGPGQGKSTITQMVAQIYRQIVLGKNDLQPENRWSVPQKTRLPFRVELRSFSEGITRGAITSVEEFLAEQLRLDSGGNPITVADIHDMGEYSPLLVIFDGLDEIGSDDSRDIVLKRINEFISRFEADLRSDLRVIVTTRPPAIAGFQDYLVDFFRLPLAPMSRVRISNYVDRWLGVQVSEYQESKRVRESFERRQNEPHVEALSRNPMQLSVLLHFIRLKGEAFPDRRAELYKEYFQIVIDRDVEKSSRLRASREIVEALHQFLGYKIHALTEANQADGTLSREHLLRLVTNWLLAQGSESERADKLFELGEERLGLIVTLKGEGRNTWYGYEIQPIREYFAAAYINEQIAGEAHSVFEDLVRRPYWKEVALFLAGLRRPNEKADLIARAKNLDDNVQLGWRQDGRTTILQLLQEGVLSQPSHVFADALDFIMDILDPELVTVQTESLDSLDVLRDLINQGGTKRHRDRLVTLLHKYEDADDDAVLLRIIYVARGILDPEILKAHMVRYRGASARSTARVRLFFPLIHDIDISREITRKSFWQGVPDAMWASALWAAGLRKPDSIKQWGSPRFHSYLVEEFTFDWPAYYQDEIHASEEPPSNWAIWSLYEHQSLLQFLSRQSDNDPQATDTARSKFALCSIPRELSYVGLDARTTKILQFFIGISNSVCQSILSGREDAVGIIMKESDKFVQFLNSKGITGWLAAKCTINLMRAALSFEGTSLGTSINQRARKLAHLNPKWSQILDEIGAYYRGSDSASPRTRRFYSLSYNRLPLLVRLKDGGQLVPITEVLIKSLCNPNQGDANWLLRMPVQDAILRTLVEACESCLHELLEWLSDRTLTRSVGLEPSPLLTPVAQRILKIVRNTNDSKILTGALTALSTSRYMNMAGVPTLAKLLSVSGNHFAVASRLFPSQPMDEAAGHHSELSIALAERVVKNPGEFPFRIVTRAASFLVERLASDLPALVGLEDQLRLYVKSDLHNSH